METGEQRKDKSAGQSPGGAAFESVLTTADLANRIGRAPDYQAENRALLALAQTLARSPQTLLQTLCEQALTLCGAQSAGIDLLEEEAGESRFRRLALAGETTPYPESAASSDFAPSGITLERDSVQLFTQPDRGEPSAAAIQPPLSELLLAPVRVDDRPVGTLWAARTREGAAFDPEDARLLTSLADFAAAGWRATRTQEAATAGHAALEGKRAEQEEREAARARGQQMRLFDTALSSIVDFVYTFDREGRLTYANRALLDFWQRDLDAARGKSFFELGYPPELAARLQRQIETVFVEGAVLKDETSLTLTSGASGVYEYIFVPVFSTDGAVEAVAGSTRDITLRYVMEEALRDTRERLEATLNAGEIATWTWDIQADRVYADKNLARFFAVPPEVAAGGPIGEYIHAVHPEDRARVRETILGAVASGREYESEYRLVGPEGAVRWVIARGRAEYDALGAPTRLPGVVLDITARKEAESTLRAHVEEIAALNARLQRAMAETHHRVKNNLQVISAMIEMQMQEHQAEKTVPIEEFAQLKTHIHTLSIVHDLLTKGLKEAEDDQRVSTQAVLDRLLPMLHQTAWNREVRFTVQEARLTAKQCVALSLVLNELVTNALKHGKQETEVVFRVEGAQAVLEVSDDGPGFPAGFDPMQAANMGLELVESLVRTDLKGRSRYETRPQGGGRVLVSFPLPPLE